MILGCKRHPGCPPGVSSAPRGAARDTLLPALLFPSQDLKALYRQRGGEGASPPARRQAQPPRGGRPRVWTWICSRAPAAMPTPTPSPATIQNFPAQTRDADIALLLDGNLGANVCFSNQTSSPWSCGGSEQPPWESPATAGCSEGRSLGFP